MKHLSSKPLLRTAICLGLLVLLVVGQKPAFATAPATITTLNFSTLPSAQGWTYENDGTGVSETEIFSVDGTILSQDTINTSAGEFNYWGYRRSTIVDPNQPFILSVRARLTGEEHANAGNACGFCFYVDTGTELFGFGLSQNRIGDAHENDLSTAVDTSQFHDYRLEGTPGVGYDFYIDNTLVASGLPRTLTGINGIAFGDLTRGPNATGEVTSYSFEQNPMAVGMSQLSAESNQPMVTIGLFILLLVFSIVGLIQSRYLLRKLK